MQVSQEKLRWLFWLRWRLLLRGLTRGSGRVITVIGSVVLLLVVLLIGGGLAVGTFFGYRAPAPWNSEILFIVFTGIYLFWIIAPLTQVSTNEGLDVSKLALFPLTRGELMLSLLFSTLLDIWTVFLVLMLAAVVAGWALSVSLALFSLLCVLVFYVQVIGISQLVIALLARMLQNRRLRDLSVVLVILLSASGYACNLALRSAGATNDLAAALQSGAFSHYLQWLPSGWAARAIQQASIGNWGISLIWLGALLVLDIVLLYLWSLVVERGLTAPESSGIQRVRRRKGSVIGVQATTTHTVGNTVITQILAIAWKEVTYFRRDPQFIRIAILPLFYVVFLAISTIYGDGGGGGSWRTLLAPLFILLSLYSISYNTLGFERQSLTTLFLFPVDPRRILYGKNLVVFVMGIIELAAIVLLFALIAHSWDFVLPSLTVGLAGIFVVIGCGNVTSVLLPQRMRQAQRGFQSAANMSAESGILRIVFTLLAMIATVIVLSPVAMALYLPLIFHIQWIWSFSIPLALIYGAILYYAITVLMSARMLARAPEILAVIARE